MKCRQDVGEDDGAANVQGVGGDITANLIEQAQVELDAGLQSCQGSGVAMTSAGAVEEGDAAVVAIRDPKAFNARKSCECFLHVKAP